MKWSLMMPKERWTQEDRDKLMKVYTELTNHPTTRGLSAQDRDAIIANRISREDFHPTAGAVNSQLSVCLRAQYLQENSKGNGVATDGHLYVDIQESLDNFTQVMDSKTSDLIKSLQAVPKAAA